MLRNSAGQPMAREVKLDAGQSASLQINSEAFLTQRSAALRRAAGRDRGSSRRRVLFRRPASRRSR